MWDRLTKTYIFPEYSNKNKSWINETAEKITSVIFANGICWKHRDVGPIVDGWIEEEAQRTIINDPNKVPLRLYHCYNPLHLYKYVYQAYLIQ